LPVWLAKISSRARSLRTKNIQKVRWRVNSMSRIVTWARQGPVMGQTEFSVGTGRNQRRPSKHYAASEPVVNPLNMRRYVAHLTWVNWLRESDNNPLWFAETTG
jgi:hypothetical protein